MSEQWRMLTEHVVRRSAPTRPASYYCKECWDFGVWNCYKILSGDEIIEGYIRPPDEAAFLSRHPDALYAGVQQCAGCEGMRSEKRKATYAAFVGLPQKYADCSFDWFDALPERKRAGKQEARYAAEQMANGGEPTCLLLQGLTGLGKSSLAACIVRGRIDAGILCRWIDYNAFLSEVYNAQQRSFQRERGADDDGPDNPFAFVSEIARTPFLVFDDMGDMNRAKPVTDYQRDQTYAVIRHRYDHRLPTVVTTNLDAKGVYTQFGPRIADRIFETYAPVALTGDNLRFE